MENSKSTECRNGHDISHSYIGYDGTRLCRKCRYNRVKRYKMNNIKKLRDNQHG